MSGGEIAQIITSLATLVAAIGALILGWRNSSTLVGNTLKLDEVHVATNGITQQLVETAAAASRAKGNLEGRAELSNEQNRAKLPKK